MAYGTGQIPYTVAEWNSLKTTTLANTTLAQLRRIEATMKTKSTAPAIPTATLDTIIQSA